MGTCASTMMMVRKQQQVSHSTATATAKVIHLDGSHHQFRHPIKARDVLSQNPGWFLCCSDSMVINSPPPHVSETDHLHPGHIYFLLPLSSKFHSAPLSLADLCTLAIIATAGLPLDHVNLGLSSVSTAGHANPLL